MSRIAPSDLLWILELNIYGDSPAIRSFNAVWRKDGYQEEGIFEYLQWSTATLQGHRGYMHLQMRVPHSHSATIPSSGPADLFSAF